MTVAPILYVEDEPEDAYLLQVAFERAAITNPLKVVTDGQQAVDYLSGAGQFGNRQAYPLPCLVLLDLKLLGMSGLEVLEWIRQQPALKPMVVIVFTSSRQPADIERAYRCGANAYILKPADTQERQQFAELLKNWWLRTNQFALINPG